MYYTLRCFNGLFGDHCVLIGISHSPDVRMAYRRSIVYDVFRNINFQVLKLPMATEKSLKCFILPHISLLIYIHLVKFECGDFSSLGIKLETNWDIHQLDERNDNVGTISCFL